MATVTVYRWRRYDITTDQSQLSRRWATAEAISRVCGVAVPGDGVQVDEVELDPHEAGMTPRDWIPPAERHGGFQRQVRV